MSQVRSQDWCTHKQTVAAIVVFPEGAAEAPSMEPLVALDVARSLRCVGQRSRPKSRLSSQAATGRHACAASSGSARYCCSTVAGSRFVLRR